MKKSNNPKLKNQIYKAKLYDSIKNQKSFNKL